MAAEAKKIKEEARRKAEEERIERIRLAEEAEAKKIAEEKRLEELEKQRLIDEQKRFEEWKFK